MDYGLTDMSIKYRVPLPLDLRTRLAPTPSGFLHEGNALSFICTWAVARAVGGKVWLRIDDMDAARCRPEYLDDIFYSLDWLGLDYDEGPADVTDFLRNHSQQLRLADYHAALDRLRLAGHLYACTCSRAEIRRLTDDSRYPGRCRARALPLDAPRTAWRVHVPADTEVSFQDWMRGTRRVNVAGYLGDFVVRQKNGGPAYQLTSLIDDLNFGINFIVRGEDLLPSSGAQLFLAQLLGETAFAHTVFWHHRLVKDDDGEKLSKSKGATAIREWRDSGRSPQPLYQTAADWLQIEQCVADRPTDLVDALREVLTD